MAGRTPHYDYHNFVDADEEGDAFATGRQTRITEHFRRHENDIAAPTPANTIAEFFQNESLSDFQFFNDEHCVEMSATPARSDGKQYDDGFASVAPACSSVASCGSYESGLRPQIFFDGVKKLNQDRPPTKADMRNLWRAHSEASSSAGGCRPPRPKRNDGKNHMKNNHEQYIENLDQTDAEMRLGMKDTSNLSSDVYSYFHADKPPQNCNETHKLRAAELKKQVRLQKENMLSFNQQVLHYTKRMFTGAITEAWKMIIESETEFETNFNDQVVKVPLEIDLAQLWLSRPKIAIALTAHTVGTLSLLRGAVYAVLMDCQRKQQLKKWKLQSAHQIRLMPKISNAGCAARSLADLRFGLSGCSGKVTCLMDVLIERVFDVQQMVWQVRGVCERCDAGGTQLMSEPFGSLDQPFLCSECSSAIVPSVSLHEPMINLEVSVSLDGSWTNRRKLLLCLQGAGYAEPLHNFFREGNRLNLVVVPCSQFVSKKLTEWYMLLVSEPQLTFAPCPRPPVLLNMAEKFPTHGPIENDIESHENITPEHQWQLFGIASIISSMKPLPDVPRYFYLCLLLSVCSVSYSRHTNVEQVWKENNEHIRRPEYMEFADKNDTSLNNNYNINDQSMSAFDQCAHSHQTNMTRTTGYSHTQFNVKEMQAKPLHCFFTGPDDRIIRTMLDRAALFFAQPCFYNDGTGQKRIIYASSKTLLYDLLSATTAIVIVDVMRLNKASANILMQALTENTIPVLMDNNKLSKMSAPISCTIWGYGASIKDEKVANHLVPTIACFDLFLPLHDPVDVEMDSRMADLIFDGDCFDVLDGVFSRPVVQVDVNKTIDNAKHHVKNVIKYHMEILDEVDRLKSGVTKLSSLNKENIKNSQWTNREGLVLDLRPEDETFRNTINCTRIPWDDLAGAPFECVGNHKNITNEFVVTDAGADRMFMDFDGELLYDKKVKFNIDGRDRFESVRELKAAWNDGPDSITMDVGCIFSNIESSFYKGKLNNNSRIAAKPPPALKVIFPTCATESIGFRHLRIRDETSAIDKKLLSIFYDRIERDVINLKNKSKGICIQTISSSLARSTLGFNEQQMRTVRIHSVLLRLSASLAICRRHLSDTQTSQYESGVQDIGDSDAEKAGDIEMADVLIAQDIFKLMFGSIPIHETTDQPICEMAFANLADVSLAVREAFAVVRRPKALRTPRSSAASSVGGSTTFF